MKEFDPIQTDRRVPERSPHRSSYERIRVSVGVGNVELLLESHTTKHEEDWMYVSEVTLTPELVEDFIDVLTSALALAREAGKTVRR